MSGGSYNYEYCRFKEEYEKAMFDDEMNDLVKDLADVLHDVEWWQSGDISETTYRTTLRKFKNKWFIQQRNPRLKEYIDERISKTKRDLYNLIGEEMLED